MAKSYVEMFDEADTSGDGALTFGELSNLLRKNGFTGSDADLKVIFDGVDADKSGRITRNEFARAMNAQPPATTRSATYRRVFKEFDKDNNGYIDKEELSKVFDELGTVKTDAEMKRMIELADKDGDNHLNYEEFIEEVMGQKV